VSVMTWISLIGITLAVFALIATLAVRSGFRAELVDTILGSNAHVTVYTSGVVHEDGRIDRTFADYADVADRLAAVPGVTRAAPLVRGQVLANSASNNAGVQVYGIRAKDLATLPRIAAPEQQVGDLTDFAGGVSIGWEVAKTLGVTVGDSIKLISPNGARTPFGTKPRVNQYPVTYIFQAGRYDIDNTRVYLPLSEAQTFFNHDGSATEIEVMVADPERVSTLTPALLTAAGVGTYTWTWQQSSGGYLRALEVEDTRYWHLAHDGLDRGGGAAGVLPVRLVHGDHRDGQRRGAGVPVRHLYRPDFQLCELCDGRRCMGSVDPGHLCAACGVASG